jgi:hypothetical protein
MRTGVTAIALALSVVSSAAQAQRINVVVRGQPVQAIARLASEGIGYSVVHVPVGTAPRSYRVIMACTVGPSRNAVAHCPTPAHSAYCTDRARLVCW